MDEPSNGRIYDGALGRFVQADPIIQDPLRVQSLNRYSYVWNNPLNATDPSGFFSVSECGANCVSFSADYLGEDVMGAAFSGGRFTIKGKEISPFVPNKTGTAAYSANATSNGESNNGKLWEEFVQTSKNSMPKESSDAYVEADETAVPEQPAPASNTSEEAIGDEYRQRAEQIAQKGREISSVGQQILEWISPDPITKAKRAEKIAESIVDAAKKEDKVADSLDVASGSTTNNVVSDGAVRAAKYSANWASASLGEAVTKFAGKNPVITETDKGKRIFTNPKTGVQVVQDVKRNYFRIYDPSVSGKRAYLDMNGNIPNNKISSSGAQSGRTQAEYNQVTHFNIE